MAVMRTQMRGESEALLAAAREAAQPASRENGSQQPRSSIDFDNLWPSGGRVGAKPPQVSKEGSSSRLGTASSGWLLVTLS